MGEKKKKSRTKPVPEENPASHGPSSKEQTAKPPRPSNWGVWKETFTRMK